MRNLQFGFLVLLVGASGTGVCAHASAAERSVSVTGNCLRKATPDRGSITLSAEFKDDDLRAASRRATEAYERAKEAVQKLKLANLDLQTSEYSVGEIREWNGKENISKGYRARMGLQVATSEIQRLGEVIALATKHGLQEVGQLSTYLSQEKMLDEHMACLKDAAENARSKADKLASALGAHVGPVISISESSGGYSPQPIFMRAEAMGAAMVKSADMAAPSVEAGRQTISLTVSAMFGLN